MKTYKLQFNILVKWIFVSLITISFTSCLDVLDMTPPEKISGDDVWKDPDLMRAYVDGVYNNIGWDVKCGSECISDNAEEPDEPSYQQTMISNINPFSNDWGWSFASIRQVNLGIENISKSTILTEELKNTLLGELYFFRGYFYFFMTNTFGGVPIIDRVLNEDDDPYLARNTEAECYQFIINDLQQAAKLLPNEQTGNAWGRVHKGSAYGMLTRVALYSQNYDLVVESFDHLQKLGLYGLCDDYDRLFDDPAYETNNKEILLYKQYLDPEVSNNWDLEHNPNTQDTRNDGFIGWGGSYPTQDLVDQYYILDDDGIARPWEESKHFTEAMEQGKDLGVAMYEQRDPRFYATIVYDGGSLHDLPIQTRKYIDAKGKEVYGDHHRLGGRSISNYRTGTGYYVKKYTREDGIIANYGQYNSPNYIFLRYGECLLNYAEAELKLGNGVEAKQAINQIRARSSVNMPAVSDKEWASDQDKWNTYERERRVELAYEDHRFNDLRRWARQNKTGIPQLNEPTHNILIQVDGSYEITQGDADWQQRLFQTPKMYYMPIPQGEVDNNPNLKQNPGW